MPRDRLGLRESSDRPMIHTVGAGASLSFECNGAGEPGRIAALPVSDASHGRRRTGMPKAS